MCVCVSLSVHIYIYIHTYIHTYVYTYIHTYLYTYIHTYSMCARAFACARARVNMSGCVLRACACVSFCVCLKGGAEMQGLGGVALVHTGL